MKTHRDIIAWQRGMELARRVYAETVQMPQDERFGLTIQLRRAAVAVPSNIAEGFGRQSRADFLRFLRMARGSLFELATQLELAEDLRMLAPSEELRGTLAETDRVLQAFIRGLDRADTIRPHSPSPPDQHP